MAKPKRSSADLDAELAALEAQLATLGQKKAKPQAPAPAEAPPDAASPAAPEPAQETRLGLKLPRRGERAAPTAPAAPSAPPAPAYDLSLWRQEDGAWVRTVPREPIVVRRVLDENGTVVREEPATQRDLEEETPVKAERSIGKLFRRKGK